MDVLDAVCEAVMVEIRDGKEEKVEIEKFGARREPYFNRLKLEFV